MLKRVPLSVLLLVVPADGNAGIVVRLAKDRLRGLPRKAAEKGQ
jgi:hypothetical protein